MLRNIGGTRTGCVKQYGGVIREESGLGRATSRDWTRGYVTPRRGIGLGVTLRNIVTMFREESGLRVEVVLWNDGSVCKMNPRLVSTLEQG